MHKIMIIKVLQIKHYDVNDRRIAETHRNIAIAHSHEDNILDAKYHIEAACNVIDENIEAETSILNELTRNGSSKEETDKQITEINDLNDERNKIVAHLEKINEKSGQTSPQLSTQTVLQEGKVRPVILKI